MNIDVSAVINSQSIDHNQSNDPDVAELTLGTFLSSLRGVRHPNTIMSVSERYDGVMPNQHQVHLVHPQSKVSRFTP